MSMADIKTYAGDAWPLLMVIVVGFLPTEMWRMLAVWMSRGQDEDSEILTWVRLVASTLLAAVVAKIVLNPTGAMQAIPLVGRIGSVLAAIMMLMVLKRSVTAAVIVGEVVLVSAAFLLG